MLLFENEYMCAASLNPCMFFFQKSNFACWLLLLHVARTLWVWCHDIYMMMNSVDECIPCCCLFVWSNDVDVHNALLLCYNPYTVSRNPARVFWLLFVICCMSIMSMLPCGLHVWFWFVKWTWRVCMLLFETSWTLLIKSTCRCLLCLVMDAGLLYDQCLHAAAYLMMFRSIAWMMNPAAVFEH